MAKHEDSDYVVTEIRRLDDKVNSAIKASKTIFLITERTALGQPLDVTIKAAEHAIIQPCPLVEHRILLRLRAGHEP